MKRSVRTGFYVVLVASTLLANCIYVAAGLKTRRLLEELSSEQCYLPNTCGGGEALIRLAFDVVPGSESSECEWNVFTLTNEEVATSPGTPKETGRYCHEICVPDTETEFVLEMFDSWGDGWNGNSLTLYGECGQQSAPSSCEPGDVEGLCTLGKYTILRGSTVSYLFNTEECVTTEDAITIEDSITTEIRQQVEDPSVSYVEIPSGAHLRLESPFATIYHTLELVCGGDPGTCVLDGQHKVFILEVSSAASSLVLRGLRLLNGYADGRKAGIVNAVSVGHVDFFDCWFENSVGTMASAVYVSLARLPQSSSWDQLSCIKDPELCPMSVAIHRCTFFNNSQTLLDIGNRYGPRTVVFGDANTQLDFLDCNITRNSPGDLILFTRMTLHLRDCVLRENSSPSKTEPMIGMEDMGSVHLQSSLFAKNIGGGIKMKMGDLFVHDCVFSDHTQKAVWHQPVDDVRIMIIAGSLFIDNTDSAFQMFEGSQHFMNEELMWPAILDYSPNTTIQYYRDCFHNTGTEDCYMGMIQHCRFENNSAVTGAAMSLNQVTLTVHRCTFHGNSASQGGGAVAISVTEGTHERNLVNRVVVLDCVFQDNQVEFQKFLDNGCGGAMMIQREGSIDDDDGIVYISGCKLTRNHAGKVLSIASTRSLEVANTANAGAICMLDAAGGILVDNLFLDNHATDGSAGALLVADDTVVNMTRNALTNNTSSAGGAIFVTNRASLNLFDSAFQSNTAYYGGGILTSDNAKLFLNTSVVAGEAKLGMCTWKAPTCCVEDVLECNDGSLCSVFEHPEGWGCCYYRGGRARCPSNHRVMCKLSNNSMNCGWNNTENCCSASIDACRAWGGQRECPAVDTGSSYGGGVMALNRSVIAMTRSVFEHNIARRDGAAVLLSVDPGTPSLLADIWFLNNWALGGGATIFWHSKGLQQVEPICHACRFKHQDYGDNWASWGSRYGTPMVNCSLYLAEELEHWPRDMALTIPSLQRLEGLTSGDAVPSIALACTDFYRRLVTFSESEEIVATLESEGDFRESSQSAHISVVGDTVVSDQYRMIPFKDVNLTAFPGTSHMLKASVNIPDEQAGAEGDVETFIDVAFRNCVIGESLNEDAMKCTLCPKGYLSIDNRSACTHCSDYEGITCMGGAKFFIEQGYALSPNVQYCDGDTVCLLERVEECHVSNACTTETTEARYFNGTAELPLVLDKLCNTDAYSPVVLCGGTKLAVCSQSYYFLYTECVKCPGKVWVLAQMILVAGLMVVTVVFTVVLVSLQHTRKAMKTFASTFSQKEGNNSTRTLVKAGKARTAISILSGYLQVISNTATILQNSNLPQELIVVLNFLGFLNVDLSRMFNISCIRYHFSSSLVANESTFWISFYISMLTPFFICGTFVFVFFVRIWWRRLKRYYYPARLQPEGPKDLSTFSRLASRSPLEDVGDVVAQMENERQWREAWANICTAACLFFTQFIHAGVSVNIVYMFLCTPMQYDDENLKDQYWLQMDASVACFKTQWSVAAIFAAFAICGFALGFPGALYLALKYYHNHVKVKFEDKILHDVAMFSRAQGIILAGPSGIPRRSIACTMGLEKRDNMYFPKSSLGYASARQYPKCYVTDDKGVRHEGVLVMVNDVGDYGSVTLVPLTLLSSPISERILGQFYEPFEDTFYFWQTYEITRRLVQVGAPVLMEILSPGTAIPCMLFTSVFFLVVHAICNPFKADAMDRLQFIILTNQFIVVFGIAVIETMEGTSSLIGWILIVLQLVVVVVGVGAVIDAYKGAVLSLGRNTWSALALARQGFRSDASTPNRGIEDRKVAEGNTVPNLRSMFGPPTNLSFFSRNHRSSILQETQEHLSMQVETMAESDDDQEAVDAAMKLRIAKCEAAAVAPASSPAFNQIAPLGNIVTAPRSNGAIADAER
ncbi:hypothetical protein CYMTET_9537 [Cymbomonas tetramitiformis]|uniref:Uncharacterized protein n=1 Tax=Cymbomonas tetramitiformis TaxID=36881 RepID=A0AAE0GRA0_9CHLO|nr:hypothetical protein CYMTET_9537 [Cymbomonas tetramitiformis]